ncbi:50S ribosomal protein L28 [Candidatus Gottesmanbacteria bacterium RBG_13_37_7]|uniref:Large ribosomal subunit protein bL28 n=1 Tax=Candidatus Gottesmanbacteria bacterium RBG_13_37_7 TaxID=1798369 RepID=A0A1F5YGP6_9BACT|nr:MAG: 50S ribosomal protein L28 [Candidatus Gottesmanbacteria bacterium RBG_13_37_7]
MALRCQNCNKGIIRGHAVSHAKNRTLRIFSPNLQKLKVFFRGRTKKALLCTSCIKRLKKYGRIGRFSFIKYVSKKEKSIEEKAVLEIKPIKEAVHEKDKKEKKLVMVEKKEEKKEKEVTVKKKELQIEDIVGKKN